MKIVSLFSRTDFCIPVVRRIHGYLVYHDRTSTKWDTNIQSHAPFEFCFRDNRKKNVRIPMENSSRFTNTWTQNYPLHVDFYFQTCDSGRERHVRSDSSKISKSPFQQNGHTFWPLAQNGQVKHSSFLRRGHILSPRFFLSLAGIHIVVSLLC